MPYPYNNKFIILGVIQKDSFSSSDNEDTEYQYIYDAGLVKKQGLEKRNYDYIENKFDLNNMPLFYIGRFFVFGENLKTIYK